MQSVKKKIFSSEIGIECNLLAVNDYSYCYVDDSIIIDVLSNDTKTGVVTITIISLPTKGDVSIELDNTIKYTATTAIESETDSFTYKISNEICESTATVYISIDSGLIPLPNYTIIKLHKNSSIGLSCAISGANLVNKYIDITPFTSATKLSNDIHGIFNAPVGYYTNGTIYRYWDGTAFTGSGTC